MASLSLTDTDWSSIQRWQQRPGGANLDPQEGFQAEIWTRRTNRSIIHSVNRGCTPFSSSPPRSYSTLPTPPLPVDWQLFIFSRFVSRHPDPPLHSLASRTPALFWHNAARVNRKSSPANGSDACRCWNWNNPVLSTRCFGIFIFYSLKGNLKIPFAERKYEAERWCVLCRIYALRAFSFHPLKKWIHFSWISVSAFRVAQPSLIFYFLNRESDCILQYGITISGSFIKITYASLVYLRR